MPIEVVCPSCQRQFRVPDKVAGKKIKCPKCAGVLPVPGPGSGVGGSGIGSGVGSGVASGSAIQRKWYLKTPDGNQYGPVPKLELDQWLAEGRITAQCQLLEEGSPQWQWGVDVYPQLNPVAAASSQAVAQAGVPVANNDPFAGLGGGNPAPADNPFAGLGASNAAASVAPTVDAASVASAAASNDPFTFAGANTSPAARVRGAKRSSGKSRKGGKSKRSGGNRSGMVTAVAIVNYIVGGLGMLGCLAVVIMGMMVGAAIDQAAVQDPEHAAEAASAAKMLTGGMVTMIAIVGAIACATHLAAGWGVQNREPWGRMLTIVLGILAILSMNLLYGGFVLFVMFNKEYADEFG